MKKMKTTFPATNMCNEAVLRIVSLSKTHVRGYRKARRIITVDYWELVVSHRVTSFISEKWYVQA